MKYNILSCFLLVTLTYLCSCNSEEPTFNTISKEEEKIIDFDLVTAPEFSTRQYNGNWLVSNREDGYGTDGLIPHVNDVSSILEGGTLTLTLYKNKVKQSSISVGTAKQVGETYTKDGFSLTFYENRIKISISFFKTEDTSNYSIYAEYYKSLPSRFNNTVIKNLCVLSGYGNLTNNTKIEIKRRASEFYVLTDEDLKGSMNSNQLFCWAILNCNSSYVYGVNSRNDPYSYEYQTYDFFNDECYAQSINDVFPTVFYSAMSNALPQTTFNGRKMWMVGGDRAYINDKGQLPLITDDIVTPEHTEPNKGQRLKYLVCRIEGNYSRTSSFAIEIPSSLQIKPNRKYVFTNKPGTKFYGSGTRSEDEDIIISADDIEIYELSHEGYYIDQY